MTLQKLCLVAAVGLVTLSGSAPPAVGETIDVAAVLFGQTVELCEVGVSGPAAYLNTTVHANDPSFPGKLTDNRPDDDCHYGDDKSSHYSSYRIDWGSNLSDPSDDTIQPRSETQVCNEDPEHFAGNGGRQFYTGDYYFAPRFLTYPPVDEDDLPWIRNYSTIRQHWGYRSPGGAEFFPVPGAGQSWGGGDYVYKSYFDLGIEGARLVLYQFEQFEEEKVNGTGPRIDLSDGFKFHRFKKFDVAARRMISMVNITEANPQGKLYRACQPSGGNCSNCTW